MIKTFKHSGDLGDIIYSLPTIKRLGGGILCLDTSGGVTDTDVQNQLRGSSERLKFNKTSFNFIKPLISAQPYIVECREYVEGEKIDVNLNEFRKGFLNPNTRSKTKNLLDLHLEQFSLPEWDPNQAWLKHTENKSLDRKMIICRSPRMQSNYPWFNGMKHILKDHAVFIGLEKEHDLFEWTFDIKIPHVKVSDALDMANYISSCDIFISNSTFGLSLAIGLGAVPVIQEVEPHSPTTVFPGKNNMQYV